MKSSGPVSWSSMKSKRRRRRLTLQGWLVLAVVASTLLAGTAYAYRITSGPDTPGKQEQAQNNLQPVAEGSGGNTSTGGDAAGSGDEPASDQENTPPAGSPSIPKPSGGTGGGSSGGGNTGGNNGGGNTGGGSGANPPVTTGKKCTLNLHWAGGNGQSDSSTIDSGGYWNLWPSSPAGGFWLYDGPHNYQYDPGSGQAEYNSIVTFLTNYLNSRNCGPVLIIGYSNGGGLAAKLFCKGEDFGGRAWGLIVDDPVMDEGVLGCNPSPNIREVLFTHSTELTNQAAAAVSGNHCSWDPPYDPTPRPGQGTGWYCENNRTMALSTYQGIVGHTSVWQRPNHGNQDGANGTYAPWHQNYVFWTTRF